MSNSCGSCRTHGEDLVTVLDIGDVGDVVLVDRVASVLLVGWLVEVLDVSVVVVVSGALLFVDVIVGSASPPTPLCGRDALHVLGAVCHRRALRCRAHPKDARHDGSHR